MAEPKTFDPDLEWMDHVRPVGLVVAPLVLKRLEAIPERQSQTDNDAAKALLDLDPKSTRALPDPWPFFRDILGWDPSSIAGAPGGPELPQELARHYPEHDTTLAPDWAVADPQPAENRPQWQLLVRIEAPGVDPDKRAELRGWEATPHQRFERLLRDTDVFAGIMITDDVLRLVYAPRGETSASPFAFAVPSTRNGESATKSRACLSSRSTHFRFTRSEGGACSARSCCSLPMRSASIPVSRSLMPAIPSPVMSGC